MIHHPWTCSTSKRTSKEEQHMDIIGLGSLSQFQERKEQQRSCSFVVSNSEQRKKIVYAVFLSSSQLCPSKQEFENTETEKEIVGEVEGEEQYFFFFQIETNNHHFFLYIDLILLVKFTWRCFRRRKKKKHGDRRHLIH